MLRCWENLAGRLLRDENMSDVVFTVGPRSAHMHAHMFILAARCGIETMWSDLSCDAFCGQSHILHNLTVRKNQHCCLDLETLIGASLL